MAKKSKIVQNERRKRTVARYAERRKALIAITKDPSATLDEKREAQRAIAKMPRDASPTRVRSRGGTTGRPRGVLTRFELDRIAFREKALNGELPGIRKASW
ncbi:MAG: 30S ribosomal protein S14 [Nitriliruptoraceae bacterium]|nr:30S ribosomal protein S14 [Nitriliruptoraceae bacterium]